MGERDARGRDLLGFLAERCPYCTAHMYLADDLLSRPICLNACTMPTWQYRLMQQGLAEAAALIRDAQDVVQRALREKEGAHDGTDTPSGIRDL